MSTQTLSNRSRAEGYFTITLLLLKLWFFRTFDWCLVLSFFFLVLICLLCFHCYSLFFSICFLFHLFIFYFFRQKLAQVRTTCFLFFLLSLVSSFSFSLLSVPFSPDCCYTGQSFGFYRFIVGKTVT